MKWILIVLLLVGCAGTKVGPGCKLTKEIHEQYECHKESTGTATDVDIHK